MCSAWSTRHARCLLRARGGCASTGSHGKPMVEGMVEFIGTTIRDHSAYINRGERTSLTKVVLEGPYARSHLYQHPETFGRTRALEWGGRADHSASYCLMVS